MYEAESPLVMSGWWNEKSCTSAEPQCSVMDFGRAMYNCSSKGSLLDCDGLEKVLEIENGLVDERFMMDELSDFCELSEDDVSAPTRNADLSRNSPMQSSETVVSCSNASAEDNIFETVSIFETSVERNTELASFQDDTSLEWLSSFNDDALIYGASNFGVDSFLLNPDDGFPCGAVSPSRGASSEVGHKRRKHFEPVKPGAAGCETMLNCGITEHDATPPTTVPGRARSKRPRSGARAAWSSPSAALLRQFSPTNSLDSTSDLLYVDKPETPTRGFFAPPSFRNDVEDSISPQSSDHCSDGVSDVRKESKKRKWKKGHDSGTLSRRCAHCLSQKTPQWRLGPTGPKTLCNACGVRFKSGRLFPEYRPAKSPTFLSYRHSNSHKKVLEMRRRREAQRIIPQDELELKPKSTLPHVDEADPTTSFLNTRTEPGLNVDTENSFSFQS